MGRSGAATGVLFLFLCGAQNGCLGQSQANGGSPSSGMDQGSAALDEGAPSDPAEGSDPSSPPSQMPAALPGPRQVTELHPDGFLPAMTLVPSGASPKAGYRVAVIGHGAGGSGRDLCEFWDPHLPKDFILVCPSGALLDRGDPHGGAYFPDHFAFRAELVAILKSLEESFTGKLRPGFRFMGYSQGATMGALAVVGEISVFEELVLMEGGAEHWTLTRAQAFGKSGGRRVILACGTRGCSRHAERAKAAFTQGEVELSVLSAPSAGHTYGGGVAEQVLGVMADWEERAQ